MRYALRGSSPQVQDKEFSCTLHSHLFTLIQTAALSTLQFQSTLQAFSQSHPMPPSIEGGQ